MKKNVLDLIDTINLRIQCDRCKFIEEEYSDMLVEFAERLDEEGWHITKSGKVECPKCKKK